MATRVTPTPSLLQWAIERSGKDWLEVQTRFPKLAGWIDGSDQPTIKQLEDFAAATYTSFGQLFLKAPPDDKLTLPDFRTPDVRGVNRPSVHLLDTIYTCEIRQEWYRNYLQSMGSEPLAFVGSVNLDAAPESVARHIADTIDFDIPARASAASWDAALTQMVRQAEDAGVMVMRSGIVANNTHRPLNSDEFSGFAMVDNHAPLVFINAKDSRSRQMFTLAHELAHIWLGESGLSLLELKGSYSRRIEQWCNAVAAELLVPMQSLHALKPEKGNPDVPRYARTFKVSTLVILRRLFDGGYLERGAFFQLFDAESKRLASLPASSGGDFYRSQFSRTGKSFARAVVISAMEGHTLYRDAYQMLGIKKQSTFDEMARGLGETL